MPFYYGWVMVGAGTIGMLLSIPGQTIGVSVFTDYLIEALGLSRDQLSLAYMIGTLSSAAILSASGVLLDRWGSRRFGSIVAALLGLALILLSYIEGMVDAATRSLSLLPPVLTAMIIMSAGFFLLRFLGQGSLTLVSRNLPMRWFVKRRGMVSAIVGTFVSFGFNSAPAFFDLLIQAAGWQGAWRISGVIVLTLGVSLYAILVRDNPESVGLKPDGAVEDLELTKRNSEEIHQNTPEELGENGEREHGGRQDESVDAPEQPDMSLPEAVKTARFWVYGLSVGLSSLFITGFTFHVVSIFAEAGIGRSIAVSVFIPVSIISVIVNFLVSFASDYIRLKWVLSTLLSGLLISMIGINFLQPGFIFTAIIILGNGLAGGSFSSLTALTWPRFFGTTHLGAISGFIMGILVAGSALGPIMLSASLSIAGSYGPAAAVLAGAAVLLLLCGIILKEEPVQRRR